jgi:geranylgeranyl diphosphate synthase type I
MALNEYMKEMRPAIEDQLKKDAEEMLADVPADLRQTLFYHMGWEGEGAGSEAQGKRIRPLLVLLCAEAAGGDWKKALPAAAAVEFIHNFSLIHDDIQDHSPLRRGRPTLWIKMGTALAINAGDLMFVMGFRSLGGLMQTCGAEKTLEAYQVLQKSCTSLTHGQHLDISYEAERSIPMQAYWTMVGGKTAALLACCAELGAIIAGAEPTRRQCFHNFAYDMGLAFQAVDDWLGIWGDAALVGKSIESDLVTGKKTLPVVYALGQNKKFAQRWLKGPIEVSELPEMAEMLVREGAETFTLKKADEFTNRSLQALKQGVQPGAAAEALEALASKLLSRQN